MFDRYTPDARQAIFLARYEASRLGSPALTAGHLWLGLLRQSPKLIRRHAPHITLDRVQAHMPPPHPSAPRISITVELPLAPDVAQALTAAAALADAQRQKHVTPEHLILGLLDQPPPA